MNIKKVLSVALIVFASLITSVLKADVTEDEIQKITAASPSVAPAKLHKPRKLLIFTRANTYKHTSIPYVTKALEIMGQKTGAYQTIVSEDMSVFEKDSLNSFDAVCFNNTTSLDFENIQHRKNLMDFIRNGKGVIGIHAATDNFRSWPEAAEMMGGQFLEHPWTAGGTWAVKIDDSNNSINKAFQGQGFKIKDEIYLSKQLNLRKNCRILLSLDFSDKNTASAAAERDVPISWIRNYEKGRVFYCGLGHNHDVLWNPKVLAHYLAGIQFAFGDLPANTTPAGIDTKLLSQLLSDTKNYDYGQDRTPQTCLDNYLLNCLCMPDQLLKVEKQFLDFLKSDATLASKDFIFRELRVIGTKQSAQVLGDMLCDPNTSDMARYALEAIKGKEVDSKFRQALNKTQGKTKIGIINSIGKRKDSAAVKDLAKLIYNNDSQIASASVWALAHIGDNSSVKALSDAAGKVKDPLLTEVYNAYLYAGDELLKNNNKSKAVIVYKSIYDSSAPENIRAAALLSLIRADKPNAYPLIKKAVQQNNAEITRLALVGLSELDKPAIKKAFNDFYARLSIDHKIQLLNIVQNTGDNFFAENVVSTLNDENEVVRIACLETLGKIGSASDVKLLAEKAATAKGMESKAASQSLYNLKGANVDKTILDLASRTDGDIKAELIKAVGERNIADAEELLLAAVTDNNKKIRIESWKALKITAGPDFSPRILNACLDVKDSYEKSLAEDAAIACLSRISNSGQREKLLLDKLASAADTQNHCSLLRILGGFQSDNIYAVVLKSLRDNNEEVLITAIKVLGNWQNDVGIDQLRSLITTDTRANIQNLALRAFISKLNFLKTSDDSKVEQYKLAFQLAKNDGDKIFIFSKLAQADSIQALELCCQYLYDPVLQPEAEIAAVNICKTIADQYPGKVNVVLEQIVSKTKNENAKTQAVRILSMLQKFNIYVLNWLFSGPYSKDTISDSELLTAKFAPEIDGFDKAAWSTRDIALLKDNTGAIDLLKIFGGNNKVIYMKTIASAENDCKARFLIGSDDGVKVWVNNVPVFENNVVRPFQQGQDKFETDLKKGSNDIVLKVSQLSGGWTVSIQIMTLDGKPLTFKQK